MHRTFACSILLCAFAAVPSACLAQSVSHRPTSLCQLGLADIFVPDQCFPPAKIGVAESKMSVRPIRPVDAASRITHLPLTQLKIRNPGHPLEIQYLFGHVSYGYHGLPDLGSHASRYVIVGELIARSQFNRRTLFRYKTPFGTTAYSEWSANFHCHDLSVSVTSNVEGRLIQSLGRSIVQEESCGK